MISDVNMLAYTKRYKNQRSQENIGMALRFLDQNALYPDKGVNICLLEKDLYHRTLNAIVFPPNFKKN